MKKCSENSDFNYVLYINILLLYVSNLMETLTVRVYHAGGLWNCRDQHKREYKNSQRQSKTTQGKCTFVHT